MRQAISLPIGSTVRFDGLAHIVIFVHNLHNGNVLLSTNRGRYVIPAYTAIETE